MACERLKSQMNKYNSVERFLEIPKVKKNIWYRNDFKIKKARVSGKDRNTALLNIFKEASLGKSKYLERKMYYTLDL